jgi:hypothetical protein
MLEGSCGVVKNMTNKHPVPSNGSLICTFADCPDREKKFIIEPYCQHGTDKGWVESEEGDVEKAFLHPCEWKRIVGDCPRGFQR